MNATIKAVEWLFIIIGFALRGTIALILLVPILVASGFFTGRPDATGLWNFVTLTKEHAP